MKLTHRWVFCTCAVVSFAVLAARRADGVSPVTGLTARAESSSTIRLRWTDPQSDEIGFRIERSSDGTAFAPIDNVGPNVTTYLDTGRPAARLFGYRLVAFSGSGEAPASHAAAASTFPATPVRVCPTKVSQPHAAARLPAVAWTGSRWGVVYQERHGDALDEILFQLLEPDLSPVGPPVAITSTDSLSQIATLRWNGAAFGLVWSENMRGEDGTPTSTTNFALLDANGSKLRGDVRIAGTTPALTLTSDQQFTLTWDGGGWGLFCGATQPGSPVVELVYYRLSPSGDVVSGPTYLTSSFATAFDVTADWNGSEYGVSWVRFRDFTVWEVLFQRMTPDGTMLGSPTLLWTSPSSLGTAYTSTLWNGTGWAVAFTDFSEDGGEPIYLARLSASGAPLGAPSRISDDFDAPSPPGEPLPVADEMPKVFLKPGGGYFVFTSSFLSTGFWEIGRLEADALGNRVGSRSLLSTVDPWNSIWNRVATNGSQFLVVYSDNGTGRQEIAGVLVSGAGSVSGGPTVLTSGHSAGNSQGFQQSGSPAVIPFREGFVAFWNETPPPAGPPAQLDAAIFDGSGAATVKIPITARSPSSRAAAVPIGEVFALAFISNGGVYFSTYDAAGAPAVAEVFLDSGASGGRGIGMAFSGEDCGVVWVQNEQLSFQRVSPGGALVSTKVTVPVPGADQVFFPAVQWTGTGWGLFWRRGSFHYYAFLDPAGGVLVPPLQVTFSGFSGTFPNQFAFVWNGTQFGIARVSNQGLDPPGDDVSFIALGIDGFKLGAEKTIVSSASSDFQPSLYWDGTRFHLVYVKGGADGLRELELLPDGTVASSERVYGNRAQSSAVAWNGMTLGILLGQNRDLYFETTACLADASRPPCPPAQASVTAGRVDLTWSAVSDPESGIYRYQVYRDGTQLAERFSTATGFTDGAPSRGVHAYEVRAMNGAYRESTGCLALTVSTVTGDVNADGDVDAADATYLARALFSEGSPPAGSGDVNGDGRVDLGDVFYLVNYLFAGGPAPL